MYLLSHKFDSRLIKEIPLPMYVVNSPDSLRVLGSRKGRRWKEKKVSVQTTPDS